MEIPMEDSNLFERMKEKAEAVQAVVKRLTSRQEVFEYAVELTVAQAGATLAAPGLPPEDLKILGERCRAAGVELLEPPYRKAVKGVHTALTPADGGIAETGTLVLDSTSEDLRLATMLGEVHVAFLEESAIVPDAFALEPLLDGWMKAPPRYAAFITGASRTADIERVLTIGVHGPGELHICVIASN